MCYFLHAKHTVLFSFFEYDLNYIELIKKIQFILTIIFTCIAYLWSGFGDGLEQSAQYVLPGDGGLLLPILMCGQIDN